MIKCDKIVIYKSNFFLSLCIGVSLLIFTSCTSQQTFTPACRHKAVYSAVTAREHIPVRIARGRLNGKPHAQAQGYVKGEWRYMEPSQNWIVFVDLQDFEVYKYDNVSQYLEYLYTIDKSKGYPRLARNE